MNRREFIALSAMGGALALKGAGETGTEPCRRLVTTSAPPRNPHPYANVFARVKAYSLDGAGEELFSQPFMLGGCQKVW